MSESNIGGNTPMLRQYTEIKRQYPGTLLFFRLGDFYELFFDDAILGARELEITLTARHKEHGAPVPMCGVPHHAVTSYIAKLVKKGYRVAICEQTEDAKATKKLVRREVVRVITPGTAIDEQLLEAGESNYLASVFGMGTGMAVAFVDVSTGEFVATEFMGDDAWSRIAEQIDSFGPREVLYPKALTPLFKTSTHSAEANQSEPQTDSGAAAAPAKGKKEQPTVSIDVKADYLWKTATLTPMDDWLFNLDHCQTLLQSHFEVTTLEGFGLSKHDLAVCAAGAALHYVRETQKSQAAHITGISYFEPTNYLVLDGPTVRNLELVESLDGNKRHTLLGTIDCTKTGMGARLIRQWLLRPSVSLGECNARLDAVAELKAAMIFRDRLREELSGIQDLERLIGKLNLNTATARDLVSLRASADHIPAIIEMMGRATSSLLEVLRDNLDDLADVRQLIATAIADNPPANLNDVGTIRAGYNAELDDLKQIATNSKGYIASIESRERERTGINSLKIKFNNVFGYFIEISKANLKNVPTDYERRQTLVNAERFTTPELKEYESRVLGAEGRILELEAEIFQNVRRIITIETPRLQGVARAIALLDAVACLAETAARRNYNRPQLTEDDEIDIRSGRHPVIEAQGERFIANDIALNNTTDRLIIITGPNMGGKSTILRQTAIISILAQIGSFVPAGSARLGLVDRIFTRVGASDSLARGRSTFMVEMIETANILNTATPRSLVILDEIGRGTATFDGLSIAWAVAEYLHDNAAHAAKTLFATHYHEMVDLAKLLPGVRNYQMAVKESAGNIVFLRKLVEGSASKSYGIEVAKIAGLPLPVVERAREILANLEANELDVTGKPKLARHLPSRGSKWRQQPSLFDQANESVLEELRTLDGEGLDQTDAVAILQRLKQRLM
ncbi:MAG TPA: DNA mismatch repair protein MutS [Blastocatellia bacterium]|nr:DNA mismatch repair protein MutS [Blastocatellia bacterium]